MKKILIISANDLIGGAGRAAFRLHQGLGKSDRLASQMLVQDKQSDYESVVGKSSVSGTNKMILGFRQVLGQAPLKLYPQQKSYFSPAWLPEKLAQTIDQINPDVINLHWVNNSFLRIETLAQFNRPIIWTLHDMWPFTGGCHYSGDCHGYESICGACPELTSHKQKDLSHWIWKRKAKAWQNLNLTIVSPSKWLARCAQASALFKHLPIEVIANGFNLDVYQPTDQTIARSIIGLPQNKKIILFGSLIATKDPRKGFHLLKPAIEQLSKQYGHQDDVEIVIFGASRPSNPPDLGFKCHYLGSFSDDITLSLIYAAADVFILPSTQDNLPNTIIEAMASGTPCVAFNIGGMPDMIDHKENGYLAEPFNTDDLATGIGLILKSEDYRQQLSLKARAKVEQAFSLEKQAKGYADLVDRVLS
jgi:glycosyltransferase involved in cell wall biosynthesis